MTQFKAVSGAWTKNAEDDYKGTCDASLSARAIRGSETDENYEFYAKVKPGNGKTAIIVNYTVGEDWKEHYIEMVLDPAGDTVKLDAVDRADDGTEETRTTLSSYAKALAYGTEYNVRVISQKLSDGSYAVYGYLDDFMLVQAEDLADPYQKGMHGLESLGVDGDATDYILSWATTSLVRVKQLLEIAATTWDTELAADLKTAAAEIDRSLAAAGISTTLSSSFPPEAIPEAQAQLAASKFKGRRAGESSQTGAKVFLAEFQRVLQAFIEGNREVTSTRG